MNSEAEKAFFQNGKCTDRRYSVCRDKRTWSPLKQWIESSRSLYKPYCGDGLKKFINDAKVNFAGQVWHLYLAILFLKNGFELFPTAPGQPDLCVKQDDRKIWIEAVSVTPGVGPDKAPNGDKYSGIDGFFQPADSQIQLRLSNAFIVKQKQIDKYITSGSISRNDLCLIAVNSGEIPLSDFTPDFSNMFKVLYKARGTCYSVDTKIAQGKQTILKHDSLTKISGETFPIGYFEDSQNQRTNGVIFSAEKIWGMNVSNVNNVEIIENFMSPDRIPNSILSCFGAKWTVKDGRLIFEKTPPIQKI